LKQSLHYINKSEQQTVPAKPKKERKKAAAKKEQVTISLGNSDVPVKISEKDLDKVKVKAGVKYPDEDLRQFKTLISNKLDEATGELTYLKGVLIDRERGIAIEDYEDMKPEEVKALIDRKKSFIAELESALDRVKKKTFGICEETGELIPKEILIRNVIIKRIKPTPDHPSVITEHTAEKIRSCRICGCTDNDCRQCIEKTGKPCHWIAEDLCSACEEEAMEQSELPAAIEPVIINHADKIELSEAEKNHLKELDNDLSSNNDNDMNFFQQLAQAGTQNVDLTMRIMQKDGKLTINIMPGAKSVTIKPILVTGTPQELDAEFFKTIAPGVSEITGIITNIEDVKKDAEKQKTNSTIRQSDNSKTSGSSKPAAKKPEKKSAPKKAAKKNDPEIKPGVNNEAVQEPVEENTENTEQNTENSSDEQTESE
jgi:PRTRC genetic system protein E